MSDCGSRYRSTFLSADVRIQPPDYGGMIGAFEFGVGEGENGAAYVTRTRDPIITNDVLYQLS